MNCNRFLILVFFVSVLLSCKKYETFTNDFDYTSVYFATQKPLRTVVADDDMSFKVGVALGGVRENTKTETVTFVVDPELLKLPGASGFEILPDSYYTLSNDEKMVITPRNLIGDITVTLNKEKFTSDPNATIAYYALPLRIVSSTTDSVLRGNESVAAKDYTIVTIQYISKFSGSYYHKGLQTRVDNNNTITYSLPDLSKNQVWRLNTVDANQVTTSGAGAISTGGIKLTVSSNNAVSVSAGSGISSASGSGSFNPEKNEFYLSYTYTSDGIIYNVKDTLIQRQPPEQELRFEEWQPLNATPEHVLSGFDLVWNDEFNGTALDLSKWNYRAENTVRGFGTVSRNSIQLNGSGQLLINITKGLDGTYYIGQVGTQGLFETRYGYFECRAKMHNSLGPHVAFWLQSPWYGIGDPTVTGAEIDIFEYHKKSPDNVHHAVHYNGYGAEHQQINKVVNNPAIKTGYHIFGLEWNENEYIFYVDGQETWRTTSAVSRRDQFIILSAELNGWGGDDPNLWTFPDAVTYDYVRVYKKR